MSVIWTILIGFIAGVIAKFVHPGPNEPSGFILTTVLGVVGAFVATYIGQSMGWYQPGETAGLPARSLARSSFSWFGAWLRAAIRHNAIRQE